MGKKEKVFLGYPMFEVIEGTDAWKALALDKNKLSTAKMERGKLFNTITKAIVKAKKERNASITYINSETWKVDIGLVCNALHKTFAEFVDEPGRVCDLHGKCLLLHLACRDGYFREIYTTAKERLEESLGGKQPAKEFSKLLPKIKEVMDELSAEEKEELANAAKEKLKQLVTGVPPEAPEPTNANQEEDAPPANADGNAGTHQRLEAEEEATDGTGSTQARAPSPPPEPEQPPTKKRKKRFTYGHDKNGDPVPRQERDPLWQSHGPFCDSTGTYR